MKPEEEKELTEHLDAIAKILYRQTLPEQVWTLAQIEATVREQTLQYITPHRIINYDYYQTEKICAIASGAVESTVKQIDRRLKISGAQLKAENISQVLQHRCAYLNDSLFA